MELKRMYSGKVNSPQTKLTKEIDENANEIEVENPDVLESGENIAVIGTGEDAETIKYTEIKSNKLVGVVRGFEGYRKSWKAGETIARNFTNHDYKTLKENIELLNTGKTDNETIENKLQGLAKKEYVDGEFDKIGQALDTKADKITVEELKSDLPQRRRLTTLENNFKKLKRDTTSQITGVGARITEQEGKLLEYKNNTTMELMGKADKTQLSGYVTTEKHTQDLATKVDASTLSVKFYEFNGENAEHTTMVHNNDKNTITDINSDDWFTDIYWATNVSVEHLKNLTVKALDKKADKTQLSGYVTTEKHNSDLNLKANKTELANKANKSELTNKADRTELNNKIDAALVQRDYLTKEEFRTFGTNNERNLRNKLDAPFLGNVGQVLVKSRTGTEWTNIPKAIETEFGKYALKTQVPTIQTYEIEAPVRCRYLVTREIKYNVYTGTLILIGDLAFLFLDNLKNAWSNSEVTAHSTKNLKQYLKIKKRTQLTKDKVLRYNAHNEITYTTTSISLVNETGEISIAYDESRNYSGGSRFPSERYFSDYNGMFINK